MFDYSPLCISSFWGKFGETEHRTQTIPIQDVDTWFRVLNDDTLVMKETLIFNDDVIEVSVIKKEDARESGGKRNIFIASFTTALARLKLYDELEKLGEQVLYYIPTRSFTPGKKVSHLYLQAFS